MSMLTTAPLSVPHRCVKAKEPISLTVLASSQRQVFERRDGRIGLTCAPVVASGSPACNEGGNQTSGGVMVSGWSAGSQGEGRGLCPGWLVLSVNGTVPTSHAHAVALIDDLSFVTVSVVFRRIATAVTLTMALTMQHGAQGGAPLHHGLEVRALTMALNEPGFGAVVSSSECMLIASLIRSAPSPRSASAPS